MTEPICPVPDELSFGEALGELDRIVAALEGGQLELEDSLTRYERGVTLLRALQAKLTDAQQKVTMLVGELEQDGETGDEPTAGRDDASAPSSSASDDEEVPI